MVGRTEEVACDGQVVYFITALFGKVLGTEELRNSKMSSAARKVLNLFFF